VSTNTLHIAFVCRNAVLA